MASKGISLPVNTVIIIAVAVLVLVVISVMFSSSTGTSTRTISHADAWNRGCSAAKVRGCLADDFTAVSTQLIPGYDPNGDSADDNLLEACKNFFSDSLLDKDKCRTKCCG